MREWEGRTEGDELSGRGETDDDDAPTDRRDRPIIEMLSLLCRRMYVLPLPRLQPSLRVAHLRPWHTNTHTHRRGIPTSRTQEFGGNGRRHGGRLPACCLPLGLR